MCSSDLTTSTSTTETNTDGSTTVTLSADGTTTAVTTTTNTDGTSTVSTTTTNTCLTFSCVAGYSVANPDTVCTTVGCDANDCTCTANSCTATLVQNSDKAFTNAVAGTTGESIAITCDTNYHIDGTTDLSASATCGTDGAFANVPQCVADPTCGDTDGSGTDFACQIGNNYLMDTPDSIQCGADGCTVAECCWVDPTCDNIEGHGAGTGSGISFSSCISGVNHLKDDLSVTCATKPCATSDCCDANPSCDNIDGSGTAMGVCGSGYTIKSDLALTCATGTCEVTDCCDVDRTCADTDGSGLAFSSDLCVAASVLRRSDWASAPACAGACETVDCCVTSSGAVDTCSIFSCDAGYSVANPDTVCTTVGCDANDCTCTHNPTCADTDGSGMAYSSGLCVAAGMLRRSDWATAPACAGSCETSDCCVEVDAVGEIGRAHV